MASQSGKYTKKQKRNQKKHRGNKNRRVNKNTFEDLEDDEEDVCQLCECCKTHQDVIAYCGNCEGFICRDCFDEHQPERPLEHHRSSTIDNVADASKLQALGLAICPKHYLQRLNFYCTDCSQMACYYCSLTDHQPPQHTLKELTDVAVDKKSEYSSRILQIPPAIHVYYRTNERIRDVQLHFLNQTLDMKDTLDAKRKRITATLRAKGRNLEAEVKTLSKERSKAMVLAKKPGEVDDDLRTHRANVISKLMIKANETEFTSMRAGVAEGLERICLSTNDETTMARRLEQTCSNTNNTSTPSSTECRKEKKKRSRRSKRNNSNKTFASKDNASKANTKSESPSKGNSNSLTLTLKEATEWREKLKVGEVGEQEEGQLQYARCVSVVRNGDIIVADDIRRKVYIYNSNGRYKNMFHPEQTYDGRPAYACSLALTSKNQVVVADLTIFVKVFTSDGTFINQVIPFADKHHDDRTALPCCVAVDTNDNIIIGDFKRKVISIVKPTEPNGTILAIIHTTLRPSFVAFNPVKNHIIVTESCTHDGKVVFIDRNNGNKQSIFVEGKIFGTHSVCCNEKGETFVMFEGRAGSKTEYSVHQYNVEGKYMGAVVKGLEYPGGMHITSDGLLAVAHGINVMLYCLRGSAADIMECCNGEEPKLPLAVGGPSGVNVTEESNVLKKHGKEEPHRVDEEIDDEVPTDELDFGTEGYVAYEKGASEENTPAASEVDDLKNDLKINGKDEPLLAKGDRDIGMPTDESKVDVTDSNTKGSVTYEKGTSEENTPDNSEVEDLKNALTTNEKVEPPLTKGDLDNGMPTDETNVDVTECGKKGSVTTYEEGTSEDQENTLAASEVDDLKIDLKTSGKDESPLANGDQDNGMPTNELNVDVTDYVSKGCVAHKEGASEENTPVASKVDDLKDCEQSANISDDIKESQIEVDSIRRVNNKDDSGMITTGISNESSSNEDEIISNVSGPGSSTDTTRTKEGLPKMNMHHQLENDDQEEN